MSNGKMPDFIVTVKHPDRKYGTRVGAVWKSQYGYSMRLDPGISISSAEGVYINLNPPRESDGGGGGDRGGYSQRGEQRGSGVGYQGQGVDDFGDEELPF